MSSHIPESDWRHFRRVHQDLLDPADQAALAGMLGPEEQVLAGWDFTTNLTEAVCVEDT